MYFNRWIVFLTLLQLCHGRIAPLGDYTGDYTPTSTTSTTTSTSSLTTSTITPTPGYTSSYTPTTTSTTSVQTSTPTPTPLPAQIRKNTDYKAYTTSYTPSPAYTPTTTTTTTTSTTSTTTGSDYGSTTPTPSAQILQDYKAAQSYTATPPTPTTTGGSCACRKLSKRMLLLNVVCCSGCNCGDYTVPTTTNDYITPTTGSDYGGNGNSDYGSTTTTTSTVNPSTTVNAPTPSPYVAPYINLVASKVGSLCNPYTCGLQASPHYDSGGTCGVGFECSLATSKCTACNPNKCKCKPGYKIKYTKSCSTQGVSCACKYAKCVPITKTAFVTGTGYLTTGATDYEYGDYYTSTINTASMQNPTPVPNVQNPTPILARDVLAPVPNTVSPNPTPQTTDASSVIPHHDKSIPQKQKTSSSGVVIIAVGFGICASFVLVKVNKFKIKLGKL